MYRRSAVAAAGGYEHLDKMEDYWLFARMIHAGARVGNVAEPLVLYRGRRLCAPRRLDAAAFGLALQAGMLRTGFTTPVQFVRNVAVRGVWRFIPTAVRKPICAAFAALRSR